MCIQQIHSLILLSSVGLHPTWRRNYMHDMERKWMNTGEGEIIRGIEYMHWAIERNIYCCLHLQRMLPKNFLKKSLCEVIKFISLSKVLSSFSQHWLQLSMHNWILENTCIFIHAQNGKIAKTNLVLPSSTNFFSKSKYNHS